MHFVKNYKNEKKLFNLILLEFKFIKDMWKFFEWKIFFIRYFVLLFVLILIKILLVIFKRLELSFFMIKCLIYNNIVFWNIFDFRFNLVNFNFHYFFLINGNNIELNLFLFVFLFYKIIRCHKILEKFYCFYFSNLILFSFLCCINNFTNNLPCNFFLHMYNITNI